MHIVIDIPEKLYNRMKTYQGLDDTYVAVKHGTPLPKGHGRLIDADELKKIINENDVLSMTGFNVRFCDINNTPTIIEADTAERSGEE